MLQWSFARKRRTPVIFDRVGPTVLLSRSLQDFLVQLPGLRDGEERAIHQSRVAIRRLREAAVLACAEYDQDEFEEIEARLVQTFKALGRARDADTAQRLVEDVESRFPLAAATLGQLRASAGRSQLKARRRVIKTLESLEMATLAEQLDRARRTPPRSGWGRESWRTVLRTHIAHRAGDLRQAMNRAGGVYFRKRSHDARVAIKQLRYALELGVATKVHPFAPGLRTLRKAQDALGEAHDREVLLERVRDLDADGLSVNYGEVFALEQFVQGEISVLHAKYLAARPRLLDVCAACDAPRRHPSMRLGAVAAAAVALPVLWARRGMLREL